MSTGADIEGGHKGQSEEANRCYLLELSAELLVQIIMEVVLQEGDGAFLTLSLVCTTFRDAVSTEFFRRQAHFQWLDSIATWTLHSASFKKSFYKMYTIDACQECGRLHKNCLPGYVGIGKRGSLRAFYFEDPHPGFCDNICRLMQ